MTELEAWLREDLGPHGDVTTRAVLTRPHAQVRGRVFARQSLVAAGLAEAAEVFARFRVRTRCTVLEGSEVDAGASLVDLAGPAGGILTAERLALNIVGHMSGIATQARLLQRKVSRINPECRIAATRKTAPGLRALEKRAVAVGGGDPHRYGLYDAILIKDNHLAAVGSVARAVERALAARPRLPVEVEVSTARDARAAALAGAHWILVDNLSPTQAMRVAAAARRSRPDVRVECSGGISARDAVRYAPFSDRVSLGRLTHSAPAADVSLELVRRRQGVKA